MSEVLIN